MRPPRTEANDRAAFTSTGEAAMKKVRLNVEALTVESFGVEQEKVERGTVKGNQIYTYFCRTDEDGCSGFDTCGYTWCSCQAYTCGNVDCY
jgi:hypothetical protein